MSSLAHLSNDELLRQLGPQATAPAANFTPQQQGYAQQAQAVQGGLPGSATNPVYDYPGRQADPAQAHVTPGGRLSVPAGQGDGADGLRNMSSEALKAALSNSNPDMPMYEDLGRSGVTGAEQGAAGAGGFLGDATNFIGNKLEDAAAGTLGALGLVPDAKAFRAQLAGQNGIADDFSGMAGMANSQQTNAAMQQVAGPYHTPQTEAGRYAQTIGQFAGGAILPGSTLQRAARVVVPAMTSETAGELAHGLGPGWETAARIGGGLAGGGAVGAGETMMAAPKAALGAQLGNVSSDQMMAAQLLRQSAAQRGVQLSMSDAVQQVAGPSTVGLGRMQRVLEGTQEGQNHFANFYGDQAANVRGAVTGFADTVAPAGTSPSVVGMRGQAAASGGLDQARQTINSLARPHYDALASQTMDPDSYTHLASDAAYAKALGQLRSNPILNQPVAHLPDENLSVVNEAVKRMDAMRDQAAGSTMAPGDLNEARLIGQGRSLASDLASDASDAGGAEGSGPWSQARQTVADLSAQHLEPLKAGPLGTMSTTPDLTAQHGALFPSRAYEGTANETGAAMRVLGQQDAALPADSIRAHLMAQFDQAARNNVTGAPPTAGAKFAASTVGTPEQAATLDTAMRTLPQGDAKADDFADLVQALQATGKRQAQGSATAFNETDIHDMTSPRGMRWLGGISLDKPFEPIAEAMRVANYKRNINGLSQQLTAPADQTASTLQAAQAATPSDLLMARILASGGAGSNGRR